MSRPVSIFLILSALCVVFYACGGDEESEVNQPVTQPDGSTVVDATDGQMPADTTVPDADVPDVADRPPVAPKDFGAAPAFQLSNLDGKLVSLADYNGQVVAVNFWATWCAPCRREVPDLIEIQEAHQDKGFTILGLSRDIEARGGKIVKDEKAVKDFVERFKVNYPVIWDTENTFNAYQGFGMPSTYVLDRDHKIRFRHAGIVDRVTLEAEILTLLNE